MKTIRLEVDDLFEDISKPSLSIIGPDYKVIVLYRDPRAIMTSITLSPDYWTIENQDENFVCAKINQNMVALNKLRHVSKRIKLVKYEDFVGQTENTLEDLYKFLGLSYLLPFAKHAIKNHIQAEPQEIKWDKVLEGENVGKITSKYSVTIYLLFFLETMEPNLFFRSLMPH